MDRLAYVEQVEVRTRYVSVDEIQGFEKVETAETPE